MKQITKELGLDDEKRVFLGLVVFKERLMMFLLSNSLNLLRDILLLLPLSSKASPSDPNTLRLQQYQATFKDYLDKIVIERKWTARFVGLSGQQHLMFGLWYLVLSLTALLQTSEVKKSTETQKVTALLNQMTLEIAQARKAYGNEEVNYSVDVFKSRVWELNKVK